MMRLTLVLARAISRSGLNQPDLMLIWR